MDLLDKAGVIKLYNRDTDPIKFAFVGSKDLSSLTELEEYNYFIDSLKAEEDFRSQLLTLDIQSIQNLV
jgi:HKD family nuclease